MTQELKREGQAALRQDRPRIQPRCYLAHDPTAIPHCTWRGGG